MRMRWGADVHWFLKHEVGVIVDPTAIQFKDPPTNLDRERLARGSGFLTKLPSKRALELMKELVWQTKRKSSLP